jgi:hypothetical protein
MPASIARAEIADAFPEIRTEDNMHPKIYCGRTVACVAGLVQIAEDSISELQGEVTRTRWTLGSAAAY